MATSSGTVSTRQRLTRELQVYQGYSDRELRRVVKRSDPGSNPHSAAIFWLAYRANEKRQTQGQLPLK